jgi:ParB family chromosome partitioning protein
MNLEKEVFELNINDIMPNRFQPREIFDEQALNELALSIKEHGVIQPIIVRKIGDKYEIIAGERRYRASQLAGKTTIPALVRDIDDKETAKIALLENLQRSDLTPIEEAKTYQTILKLDNITQEELAANLGKSQSTVANKLRLLNLAEEVQTALLNKQISERHARSLLNVPNLEEQKKLLNQVIMNRLTVRQLDDEIMTLTGKKPQEEQPIEHQNKSILEEHINKMENDIVANAPQPQEQAQVSVNVKQQEPQIITMPNEIKETQPEVQTEIKAEIKTEPTPKPNIFDMLRQESTQNTAIEQPSIPKVNINTDVQNQPLNIKEQPIQTEQSINIPTITETQPQEIKTPPEQAQVSVNNNQQEPQVVTVPNELKEEQPSYKQVYDLRFAINNVRQAVQNTEKFGFNIDVQEFDLDNVYQIIIKIDKNKF